VTTPGRTTVFVAAALAVALLGVLVVPELLAVVLVGDALLLAACLIEGRALRRTRVTVQREGWTRAQINRPVDLVYRIENMGRRGLIVTIRQPWPASFESEAQIHEVSVGPGETVRVAQSVVPHRRGRVRVRTGQWQVRFASDLARRRRTLRSAHLAVYPDLRRVAEYDVLRRHRALRQFGIHRMRMVGTGRDFDQLRDYQPDDDYRDIDWMATARRREPITAVYQAERSQDVMLCLDSGRMMGSPIGAGTALDHAVDAALVLAHVCQKAQDRVGLALFRDTVHSYIKPMRAGAGMSRIIAQLVDLAPQGVFPSYKALIAALRANQKRRAMVFLFTDLNDPQLASNLIDVLPLVSRRHVFVVVSLRDPLLDSIASGPVQERRGLYQVLAARHLADERAGRVRELIRCGVKVLEVDADRITVELINTYLVIKTRQLV
jgi:uncharacterized protein (DUF58 family)